MEAVMKHERQQKTDIVVRLEAVKIAADEFRKEAFGLLTGYRRVYDYRLPGGDERMYERVCQFVNDKTGMKIGVSYNRMHSYMPPCITLMSPCDRTRASVQRLGLAQHLQHRHSAYTDSLTLLSPE